MLASHEPILLEKLNIRYSREITTECNNRLPPAYAEFYLKSIWRIARAFQTAQTIKSGIPGS